MNFLRRQSQSRHWRFTRVYLGRARLMLTPQWVEHLCFKKGGFPSIRLHARGAIPKRRHSLQNVVTLRAVTKRNIMVFLRCAFVFMSEGGPLLW